MTAQEIYDTVARALLAQGRPSICKYGRCLYRGPDGLKCAIGHLIPDENYDPKFEGLGIDNFFYDDVHGFGFNKKDKNLLVDLQLAHDDTNHWQTNEEWRQIWKDRMLSVAKDFDLDISVFEKGDKL